MQGRSTALLARGLLQILLQKRQVQGSGVLMGDRVCLSSPLWLDTDRRVERPSRGRTQGGQDRTAHPILARSPLPCARI